MVSERTVTSSLTVEGFSQFLKQEQPWPLFFSDSLVKDFFDSVTTNPFSIIGGAPGSGKTALCEAFLAYAQRCCPKEIDGKTPAWISGESSWNDREHLVGRYHEAGCDFMVTPFLEHLLWALRHRDEHVFFLIDGIDLGCLEGFLADAVAAIGAQRPMPLHPKQRCIPAATALPEERNLICHDDCHRCFFACRDYQGGAIPKTISCFVPPFAIFPENFHLMGTLQKGTFVEGLPLWMIDKISLVYLGDMAFLPWLSHCEGEGLIQGSQKDLLKEVFSFLTAENIFPGWRIVQEFLIPSKDSDSIFCKRIVPLLLKSSKRGKTLAKALRFAQENCLEQAQACLEAIQARSHEFEQKS